VTEGENTIPSERDDRWNLTSLTVNVILSTSHIVEIDGTVTEAIGNSDRPLAIIVDDRTRVAHELE
jgi:hypothetical protein